MPTRKQRRREAKQKRHEYEFVYLDDEGNEIDPPPEELAEAEPRQREERRNGKAATAKAPAATGGTPARGGRTGRVPQPPSWERAARRSLILGAVVFVLFYLSGKWSNRLVGAVELAVIYTALFIPLTFMIDRFAYGRYQARQQGGGRKEQGGDRNGRKPPRKR